MTPLVGILLDRSVLERCLRGVSTFERVDLYAKAAAQLGTDLILFHPGAIDWRRRRVVGYRPAQDGGMKRVVTPLPRVVHKRGLNFKMRDVERVRRLAKSGVHVFNPEIPWDKYRIHRLLASDPRLQTALPECVPFAKSQFAWFRQQLAFHKEVFIKPRRGSLGLGVTRVLRIAPQRYRVEARGSHRISTLLGSWQLARVGRRSPSLMQVGIPLLEDEGKRVDFRVPVQLGDDGEWKIPGIAARRAERSRFLTNLARGGSVHPAHEILGRHFGTRQAERVMAEMRRLACLVAEVIQRRYPRMVDFGIDIGVDHDGRPFIIEVNRRDLRVLLERSGQAEANEQLFATPLRYARAVLNGKAPQPRNAEHEAPSSSTH